MDQVAIVRCDSYQQEQVNEAVREIMFSGDQENVFVPGRKVFLKVNLLMKKKPEEAVTTHPAVVRAVAGALINKGCLVTIGDSPGGPYTPAFLRGVYKETGMTQVAEETGCELNYNVDTIEVPFPEGYLVKSLTICRAMWEADAIVSLAKLKTHGMTTFTGAVKNLFGVIPGLIKVEYHFRMPERKDFSHLLVDICQRMNPCFSIIDGIVGMEGEGPSSGNPRKVNILLGGENPHAVDTIGAFIIGLSQEQVPTLQAARERSLVGSRAEIKVLGPAAESLAINNFKLPLTTRNIHFYRGKLPRRLEKILDSWLTPKPVFQHRRCVGCGICAKHCPPGVISMIEGKPYVDLGKCIRCYCCQELCPEKAVVIHRPWITDKIIFRK